MFDLPQLTWNNNKEEIVLRLHQGEDINQQDIFGQTALLRACENNYTELVEILLKNKKIKVNLQNKYGRSPFYNAGYYDSYECVLIMVQDPRVDINLTDDYDGISPLMDACYDGRTKTVKLLISFGRNIDIHKKSTKDNDYYGIKSGSTALDMAKQRNRTDIVQLLEQYQNYPKETQKTNRNELNLKGNKIKYKNNMKKKKKKTVMK